MIAPRPDKISQFAREVYRVAARIPAGRVACYSDIARAIGHPKSSRAVGNALHANPFVPQVPCHRVVRSDGRLGGFLSGSRKKAKLLEAEGVPLIQGRIPAQYFYEF